MTTARAFRESRMHQILDLLTAQTRDGTIEWKEGFGSSYKTSLGDQTIILERDNAYLLTDVGSATGLGGLGSVLASAAKGGKNTKLEIRGRTGEVAEKVESPEYNQPFLFETAIYGNAPQPYSLSVFNKLDDLYDLVRNRKDVLAEKAIDDVLSALKRRAK